MSNFEEQKQKLEAELATLEASLKELGIQNPQATEDWVATPEDPIKTEADENVVADNKEEWIERRAEVSALETRYNNIVLALKKMEAGTYGVCEISGEPIEADRLAANPAARTCKAHMDEEAQLSN